MTEFNGRDQFKRVIDVFTSGGFLSFKKLFNFVFPSKEDNISETFGGSWRKVISYTAPLISILILSGIFFMGYLWGKKYEMGLIMFGLHFLICSIGVIHLGVLFLLSIVLKIKKRSPAVLLGLTVLFPVKALAFLGVVNAIFFVFIANTGSVPHTTKIKKHSAHYESLFASNEASVDKGHENKSIFGEVLYPKNKESSSAQGCVEDLFQENSERRKEEIKQMHEKHFKSVEENKKEWASKKADFGKHCVLLGKMTEEEKTPPAKEETSENVTEINVPLFFGWDKAPYDTVQTD